MAIRYRCPVCWKRGKADEDHIGLIVACRCGAELRVPRKSGYAIRSRRWPQRLLLFFLCGFGGAFMCFCPSFVFLGRLLATGWGHWAIGGVMAVGFLIDAFGGERGLDWIGSILKRMFDR